MKQLNLSAEEQDLLDSFEREEWHSVKDVAQQKKVAKAAAEKFLKKDMRINIRISSNDLKHIKEKAAFEGMPYQTLVASVLHKYASGHL